MELNRAHFSRFMAEAYGQQPFAWQLRLLDFVLDNQAWPQLIAAPTGSGKTTVIDIHVFVNALAAQNTMTMPRRMVMTVNRRNLIDDHAAHATRLVELLSAAAPDSILYRVNQLLDQRSAGQGRLLTHVLRGGLSLASDWRLQPLSTAVIAATPDMWGSRVLFSGYGTSRHARSIEAGLLTKDCVLVIDESHLNRQLITTARRISELETHAAEQLNVPNLQVVETTATPGTTTEHGLPVVQVSEADLESSATLKARLTTAKRLSLRPTQTRRDQVSKLAQEIAAEALELRARFATVRKPVGVIVNTVDLASEVILQLEKHLAGGEGDGMPALEAILGAQRPFDRIELEKRLPELFDVSQPSQLRYLVATQTLEVGVDLDLTGLVTELAPGSAIAQRAGRVNRIGSRSDAEVVVVVPDYSKNANRTPYTHSELETALAWLERRAAASDGLAPWSLIEDPPPAAERRRILYQRPEWNDALYWSRTSEDLASSDWSLQPGGTDLTLWLRDEFSDSAEAGLVVRDKLTGEHLMDAEILRQTPVLAEEVYSVRTKRLTDIADRLLDAGSREYTVLRDGQALQLLRPDSSALAVSGNERFLTPGALRAGDILIVTPADKIFRPGNVPHPAGTLGGNDVYDDIMRLKEDETSGVHIRLLLTNPAGTASPNVNAALDLALLHARHHGGAESLEVPVADLLAALVPFDERIRELSPEDSRLQLTVIPSLEDDGPVFVLVSTMPTSDGLVTETSSSSFVSLDSHQQAVAGEAALLATQLNLAALQEPVVTAARHHDEGKREDRFQEFLRGKSIRTEPLAKAPQRVFDRKRWSALGLRGWRHEQLSAAWLWADDSPEVRAERNLITWLAGTSHGRGRTTFRDGAEFLLPQRDDLPPKVIEAAFELYNDGAWDDIFEPLCRRFGPWSLAYLEAIVRIADQRVSAEGR